MRTLLPMLAAALLGCGDNLTEVARDDYQAGQIEPLACVPNLDGRIDAHEVTPALDVPVRYLVSPADTTRAVNIAGESDAETGLRWDWSVDLADDQQLVVTAAALGPQWYASSFEAGAFVVPFDAAGRVHSVLRHDEQALWLLGIASAEADPPEGRTLAPYREPIAILRFPVQPGQSYLSVGLHEGAVVRGLPYAGTDTYAVEVDATGAMDLPQLTFTQAHRVRTQVTVSPAVGAPTTVRQVSYFFECFAEVARATSLPGETAPDFSNAAEVWRLGIQ